MSGYAEAAIKNAEASHQYLEDTGRLEAKGLAVSAVGDLQLVGPYAGRPLVDSLLAASDSEIRAFNTAYRDPVIIEETALCDGVRHFTNLATGETWTEPWEKQE